MGLTTLRLFALKLTFMVRFGNRTHRIQENKKRKRAMPHCALPVVISGIIKCYSSWISHVIVSIHPTA